jgi:hypothetical protein
MIDHITANKIYDVASGYCGATESHRDSFCWYAMRNGTGEYRFCGNLGLGGKLYLDHSVWRISCYREDETVERRVAISHANEELAELHQAWRESR